MPASSINLYHMQDAKNNFNAVRPVPLCTDTNTFMSQCRNIHISTNCYYGYHDAKPTENVQDVDCEMVDVRHKNYIHASVSPHCKGRKRSAEDDAYVQNKRLREVLQTKKIKKPETTEKMKFDTSSEEYSENLYWSTHGGTMYYNVTD